MLFILMNTCKTFKICTLKKRDFNLYLIKMVWPWKIQNKIFPNKKKNVSGNAKTYYDVTWWCSKLDKYASIHHHGCIFCPFCSINTKTRTLSQCFCPISCLYAVLTSPKKINASTSYRTWKIHFWSLFSQKAHQKIFWEKSFKPILNFSAPVVSCKKLE